MTEYISKCAIEELEPISEADRWIDRHPTEFIDDAYETGWRDCQDTIIDMLPTVQIEIKTGRWIHTHTHYSLDDECWKCSECGFEDAGIFNIEFKYCPNCGAKMEET